MQLVDKDGQAVHVRYSEILSVVDKGSHCEVIAARGPVFVTFEVMETTADIDRKRLEAVLDDIRSAKSELDETNDLYKELYGHSADEIPQEETV